MFGYKIGYISIHEAYTGLDLLPMNTFAAISISIHEAYTGLDKYHEGTLHFEPISIHEAYTGLDCMVGGTYGFHIYFNPRGLYRPRRIRGYGSCTNI